MNFKQISKITYRNDFKQIITSNNERKEVQTCIESTLVVLYEIGWLII